MVTVAIRALELEYLVKILDWGRSRYIFTDSDATALLASDRGNPIQLRKHANKTRKSKEEKKEGP
jgi:hypothetical protein